MIMMLWYFHAVFVPFDVYIVKVHALHERQVGCDVDINIHTLIHNELFSLKLILECCDTALR